MHRSTYTTGRVSVVGLALCGGLLAALLGIGAVQAQGAGPAGTPGKAPAAQPQPQPASPPASQPVTAQPQPTARGDRQEMRQEPRQEARQETRQERRRRASYAACNRQSHNRGLRGGARRRFLVRCKLGYERPRAAPVQPPAPARQP